jgi:hypothetical protein
MYATAHLDLVHETVAEQLRSASAARATTRSAGAPVAPARLRTWGPRASRRPVHVALADVIRMPAPRASSPTPGIIPSHADAVLLDA